MRWMIAVLLVGLLSSLGVAAAMDVGSNARTQVPVIDLAPDPERNASAPERTIAEGAKAARRRPNGAKAATEPPGQAAPDKRGSSEHVQSPTRAASAAPPAPRVAAPAHRPTRTGGDDGDAAEAQTPTSKPPSSRGNGGAAPAPAPPPQPIGDPDDDDAPVAEPGPEPPDDGDDDEDDDDDGEPGDDGGGDDDTDD